MIARTPTTRHGAGGPGGHLVLLRRAGQDLGQGPGERLGVLHRPRRRPGDGVTPTTTSPTRWVDDQATELSASAVGASPPVLNAAPRTRAPARRRSARYRVPDHRRDRLGDHGHAAVARRRRLAAARERRRHCRRADRPDPDVRRGVGRPLQPGRHARRPNVRHDHHPRRDPLLDRPDRRRMCRAVHRQRHVRARPDQAVDQALDRPARCGCPRWSRRSGCCW